MKKHSYTAAAMMTTVQGERHIMAAMVKEKEHAYNAYQN